jgi:hypothetical protein
LSPDIRTTIIDALKPIGLGFGIALGSALFNLLREFFR